MSTEGNQAYSREAYEKKENEVEAAIESKEPGEIREKFAEQDALHNKAHEEAIAENKERASQEATELLQKMQSNAEFRTVEVAPTEKGQEISSERESVNLDDDLQEFADKFVDKNMRGDFGVGRWHGEDRKVFIADQLRDGRDKGKENKVRDTTSLFIGAGSLGLAGSLATLEGATAFALGAASFAGGAGIIALGIGGYSIYKGIKNWRGRRQFEKQFGSIDQILAKAR